MSKKKGRSIELFFVDGTPDGMVTATIPFQWSGHVLVTRRTQLKEAISRSEAKRPGVYLLIGDLDGENTLYIGETDELKTRLTQHAASKDWWDTAILITSNGEPLNKAHVRYLEHKMFTAAKWLNKITLSYGQAPSGSPLSEAARAHMDDFLENIYLVLPALRFDFFTAQVKDDSPASPDQTTTDAVYFTFNVAKHGITSRARWEDGKFVVEAGSLTREKWASTASHPTYKALFEELVDQGVLVPQGPHRVFAKSYVFNSTSAAAAVISGRPASGPKSWLVENTGQTYGDWEAAQLQAVEPEEQP
ncbi:GIY-YIG nuclease family protein [Antarcticimicrobium sediminis]|uniref:GIY-YIG nuclease family protein n=1 Tax=Antarcticimicrobium sediminis TaxID=2546227 RepID=A0A4R5ENX3_9RHOB|nr:GIY-YIG nuclease family protein [Antarcticimicrobium sediminis]TDE36324.1 GIY-YIG nuclease family protein [Antarcticimicrobium sediminis]